MGIQKKTKRNNDKRKNKQSEIRDGCGQKPRLTRQVVSVVAAMGIFANALTASATVTPGADFTKVTSNGNVITIETEKIINRSGVNIFKEFGLNANQIANMYFGTKTNSTQADNLVNFVNSHIDINGTVNAVKNNAIGGNLYFLSTDGMAVGKSGVINAGALHVMTPTADQMANMQNVLLSADPTAQKKQLDLLYNSPAQIPLNSSGTITVLGKINATDKIDLRAANILVGFDGNTVEKTAALRTGVVNFADLVNIPNVTQSGLTGNLTATMTGSGDIILKASADAGTKSIGGNAPAFISKKLNGLADEVTYREISASVKNHGTIEAAGNLDISATAENVKKTDTSAKKPGSLAKINATVDLKEGSVSGKKNVSVTATAKNEYVDEDGAFHKATVLGLGLGTPITSDVAFAVLDTEALVNIGSNASVSGDGVSISAESTTLAATKASATGYKYVSKGGQNATYIPAGAVVYTEATNKAEVNIDGKVEAISKDIKVSAKADLKIDATNNLAVKGQNSNQIVVGVMVTNGDNTAQVNIKDNQTAGYEKALTANGDIGVKAEAINDLNSEENVAGSDASALVTVVNVTNYNSKAGVNVDRSLKAGNDLNINANNTFTRNTVISNNKIGAGKYMTQVSETLNKVGATDAIKAVGGNIKKALLGDSKDEDMTYQGIKLAELLKAGVTVAVANESNAAAVNIGPEAGLTAEKGKITLDAKMQMDDIHMVATGASNSYTKDYGGGIVGNATVMVTNLNDSAAVTIADRSDASAGTAALAASKGVSINSSVKADYNRVQKMIEAVKKAAEDIKDGFSGLDNSIKNDWQELLDSVTNKAGALKTSLESFSANENLLISDNGAVEANNHFAAAVDLLSALNTLNAQITDAEAGTDPAKATSAQKLKQAISGLADVVTNSVAFADPNSYANFGAVSKASGDDGSSGTGTTATIAGTVMITNVDHNSKVLLGNNVKIKSSGTVNVGAENLMKDVSLAGVTATIFNNTGGKSSVGATVNLANFDTNTVVAVGKGSHITGGEININGHNTVNHVAVAASAGKGASGKSESSGATVNGMVSIINGDSKVLTIVDDEASLTAAKNTVGNNTTRGSIAIKGKNDTSLVNVAGGIAITHSNGAVGVGVAVNNFSVHNIAGIGDVKTFGEEIFGANNSKLAGGSGYTTAYTATVPGKKGANVTAYGLDVETVTDGTINTVSAAGSVSSNDTTGEEGFFDKLGNGIDKITNKVVGKDGLVGKAGKLFANKVNGDGSSSSPLDNAFNINGTKQGGGQLKINRDNQSGNSGFMPEFSIADSGSVSVNSLNNKTKAVVDNAVIDLNDGDMSVVGKDTAFVGSYSGAAAIVWKSSSEEGKKGKSVALAGAAAVNDIDNTVSAVISNSKINNAGNIDVLGLSGGTTIAAGLGLEISKNEGDSGSGGAAVSVNLIDHTVNALMDGNTVNKASAIDVTAYQSDVQVTGGLQVAAGNQGKAVGASVAVASLNNTINAGIKGAGKNEKAYTNIGNVEVHALNALTAVTAAVSAGATSGGNSNGPSFNIQGAVAYNSVNNKANAYIDAANIETSPNGSVRVRAMDTNTRDASAYQTTLEKDASDKVKEISKTSSIIDTKGNSYYDGLDTGMTDDGTNDGTLNLNSIGKSGSTIVTAAAGVAVTGGDDAAGASVAISNIHNSFTAKITNSDITAENVEAQANSDTLSVGVAGGVGVGSKIGGVGSVSWQDIDNTALATISGSTIKAQNVNGKAVNTAKMINVAGQIAGGKTAIGAALGYSGLNNVTGAYLLNNTIDKRTADTEGVSVNAYAANGNKIYTIGASVGVAAEGAAITGTVAITHTGGKTEALLSDSQIDNAKAVGITAEDTAYTYTVMGNVAAGAKAGVGAGVAYTDIGGASGDAAKAGQITAATIEDTQIKSAAADSSVKVSAKDTSKVLNIAAGIGGAGNVAVQGAASTALINKQTQALIKSTDIDKDQAGGIKANVSVKAGSDSKIFNTAVVAAGSRAAAVGAGVAVNRIVQQTGAEIHGGVMNLKGLDVRAVASPKIETIGVGGAVGGNVGVSGSVAVNMIKNNVTAHIGSGAVVTAQGSVGVVAQSDERISNYAGTLSGGGTAAVGVSTSVNQISGVTEASIGAGDDQTETKVTAKGNDAGITTNSTVGDDQIHDTLISKKTVAIDSHIKRTASTQKGIVVDASSTRDLKSFLINASGGENVGVAATVNVNMIDGDTKANVNKAVLNDSNSNSDVTVRAGDYTNSSGFVGSLGVGVEGAGVGAGSDTNIVKRNVAAEVSGSKITAQALKVLAEGKQGISSLTVGAGIAGIGAGAAGMVTVSEMDNTTKAVISDTHAINVAKLNVEANHLARVNSGNISAGAGFVGVGVGLSVGVFKDNSVTEAEISNSDVDSSGDQTIAATNKTSVKPVVSATGLGLGGVAGSVSVNNVNGKVKTNINNTNLKSVNGSISSSAQNTIDLDAYTGSNAVGAIGVGASVSVNTIDSSVQNNVVNSKLQAGKNIALTAEETRKISQLATNVAASATAGIGGNIIVNNIGKALSDADDNEKSAKDQIKAANSAYGTTDMLGFSRELGALDKGSINADANTVSVDAGFGVDKKSQISVNIDGGSIEAQGKVIATAKETDNITMTAGSGALGLAAVNAGVGILNVHHNLAVTIDNVRLTGAEIRIGSEAGGTSELNMYQGSGGLLGLNAAYGRVSTEGFSLVNISNSALTSDKINVTAEDKGNTRVKSAGLSAGVVAAGVIVAQAENDSDTQIVIKGSTLKEKTTDNKTGAVSINAEKATTVEAHAIGGSVGFIGAANGVVATARDSGKSSVLLTALNSKVNEFGSHKIDIKAINNPAVKASADSAALALGFSGGASAATATADGKVEIDASAGNIFAGDIVEIAGKAGTQKGKNTTEATVTGIGGALAAGVAVNVSKAESKMNVNVNVGNAGYKTKTEKVVDGYTWQGDQQVLVYKDVDVAMTELTVEGVNATKTYADTKGLTIGGVFASGNNVAKTQNTTATNVSVTGGDSATLLKSLQVTASGAADNLAKADGSGGALISGDRAAFVENTMGGTTSATIGGSWNVSGDVSVNAIHSDTANVNADALKATLLGASATKAVNNISSSTGINIADNAVITTQGTVNMLAENQINIGDKEKYGVKGSGYGGINVQGAVLGNNINNSVAVKLGNARITSAKEQNYEAKTIGDITAGGYIKAAGAGAFTLVDVNNTMTNTNSVALDNGGSLKTTGAHQDITLAAADMLEIKTEGVADTQGGAIGGASSNVASHLTRNNKITVDGTIYSMNDTNLYAGADKKGSQSKLDLKVVSEAYNKTALAVSNPKLSSELKQNNQAVVNNNGKIKSVRNINVVANSGQETVRESSYMYTWYWSDKKENYASSTVGNKQIPGKTSDNYALLNGNLQAGVQNKQHLTIGGDGQIVVVDAETLAAAKNVPEQADFVGAGGVKLDYSSGVDADNIKIGIMDYGNELLKRYDELGKLLSEYSEKSDSVAAEGYRVERRRIFDEMKNLGLVYEETDAKGEKYWDVLPGMAVDYISIPDIIASGGNININADTLTGSGSIEAKGSPEITITNNTNLYMKINDVIVGDAGGSIVVNGTVLGENNYTDTIKTLNKDKSKEVRLGITTTDAGGGGSVVIKGNYGGKKIYAQVDNEHQAEMQPKADIEINGSIENMNGDITIESKANNIIIQGKDASSSAGINGKNVYLNASNGSITQGFTEGIVNIGGSVEAHYSGEYEDSLNHFGNKYGNQHTSNVENEVKVADYSSKTYGNRIAGGNIYINATDINVNGYIQSGYADYELTLDSNVQNTINDMQKRWLQSGSPALSDAMVNTGITYRISVGQDVPQNDGTYKRAVDAYYNPSTGKIIVPDIDAKGGQVYLNGRISSTGNGKIIVLDGASSISVKNSTATDLQVGDLISNNVEGLISIADSAKKQVTEIRRSGTTIKDMATWDANTGDWKIKENDSQVASIYNPQEGLRYNWTNGSSTVTKKDYSNTVKAGWWGLGGKISREDLECFEQDHDTSGIKLSAVPKANGSFIGSVNTGGNNDKDFVMIYANIVTKDTRTTPTEERWSTGFLGFKKWVKYSWSTTLGTVQHYVSSVKADKPISIGFIGSDTGKIDVNSAGNIDLNGNIRGNNGNSTVKITSTQGAIKSSAGSIIGDKINLNAAKGIENINITSMGDVVSLNAINSGKGNIDIKVNAAYNKKGDVNIGTISTRGGSAALTADGSITKSDAGVAITADRIDLVSKTGTIGTKNKALLVQGGQSVVTAGDTLSASVNASASGNINMTQDHGNMRLGRVSSSQGDVTLTVNSGDLVDALPTGETIDRGDTASLIQKWKDLGLIDGDGAYKEKQEQGVNEYKNSVTTEYNQYEQMKSYYGQPDNDIMVNYKDEYYAYTDAEKTYTALKDNFTTYQTQALYYNDSNTPKRSNYRSDEAYASALNDYNSGKAAFEALATKCSAYANADAYIKAMDADAYNNYLNPIVGKQNMKISFDSYNNYQKMENKFTGYNSAANYLSGAEATAHIDKLREKGAGWQENELLYAIQDSIINPDSGATNNIIKDPNIKGNNITLNVQNGSVGLNSGNITTIDLKGLNSNVDALKKLANADASDVKWDVAKGTATISEKNPLGIEMKGSGKLSINAKNNVYVAGRTENNAAIENKINIGNIFAAGNIRIQGNDGIFNAGSAIIQGNDLLIQGGKGSLGSADNALTLALSGSLQAQSEKGIYLTQGGGNAMKIFSIGAGGDIVLQAEGDIVNEDSQGTAAQGHIRSDAGTITVTAGGSVGTEQHGLRIQNAADGNEYQTVSVKAQNIYLEGISTDNSANPRPLGTMHLGKIETTGADGAVAKVEVNGNAVVSGELNNTGTGAVTALTAANNIVVKNNINNGAGNLVLAAAGDLALNEGALRAVKVNLNAGGGSLLTGSITQGDSHVIDARDVVAAAVAGIGLGSSQNQMQNVDVLNIAQGNVNIANSGSKDLSIILEKKNDGDVTIHNYANNDSKKVKLNVISQVEASGHVQLINDTGDVQVAAADSVNTANNSLLVNKFSVKADKAVEIAATGGSVINEKDVTGGAGYNVTMTSVGGNILNKGALTAGGAVHLLAKDGNIINNAAVSSGTGYDVQLTAGGDISNDGALTAGNDVRLTAGDGNINIGSRGAIISRQGSIGLTTGNTAAADKGKISINASMEAKKDINVFANHGNIFFGSNATAHDGTLTVNVIEGNIKSDHFDGGDNAAGNDVKLASLNGSVNIYTPKGDVDIHEIYAKDKAFAGTENGYLRLCKIDGNIVVLITKDMSNAMDVKDLVAGSQVIIAGNKISMDDIKQRTDADGVLNLSLKGAKDDEPIETFNIKNINTDNGVRLDKLWVKNAELHVNNGKLYIDKLAVADVAHFSNRDMLTTVYGTNPRRDGSDSIYWYNYAANNPKNDLLNWQNGGYSDKWMNLYFTDIYRTQYSNGILLSLKDYYYAYNQRFTGENHLRFLKKETPLSIYAKNNNSGLSLYQRFALYELPKEERQPKVSEDDIVLTKEI